MHPALHRALEAYRPMYLNGLQRDGQYRLPKRATAPPRRGGLLIALAGLLHPASRRRKTP